MKLVMGIIVVAMGAVIAHHTWMGFVQIGLGAVLVWIGVINEIKETRTLSFLGMGPIPQFSLKAPTS
jgi:hypothetical protein